MDDYIFQATTTSLNHLSSILSSIPTTNVLLIINQDGLIFITEDFKTIRLEILFSKELFTEFKLKPNIEDNDEEEIKLNFELKPIVESLNIASREKINQVSIYIKNVNNINGIILIYQDFKIVEKCEIFSIIDNDIESFNPFFEILDDNLLMDLELKNNFIKDLFKEFKEFDINYIHFYSNGNGFNLIGKNESSLEIYKIPSNLINFNSKIKNNKILTSLKYNLLFKYHKIFKYVESLKILKTKRILNFKILSTYLCNNSGSKNDYTGTLINLSFMLEDYQDLDINEIISNEIESIESNDIISNDNVPQEDNFNNELNENLVEINKENEIDVPLFL
ncbi:hypothetical protein WICMUC_004575 [Wickerhamomyces mucosus]|uniref:DNA damage checkpoint control protein RAD17 n=1 Tax=Wickerhamomyces mucosus TaxID=1378264 RepID=A0A9P8TAM7_9ASCO|nr:hypothetical protein WICMUC_004575 [Wickerhamomyces mucosus]